MKLDYSFEQSENKKGIIAKWLEQFYICFIDLFNLKTKTMKKLSILSILTAALVFGVYAVNGQLNSTEKSELSSAKTEIKNAAEKDIPFYDFSCFGCMEQKGLLIGRDMSFTLKGVKVKNIRLMAIDQESQEFNALFIKGQFFDRKVILEYPKDWLIDGSMEYSANKVEKLDNKIILLGNAKVFNTEDKHDLSKYESIEAKEIIIHLK